MSSDLTRLQGTPSPAEIAGRNTDPRFFATLSILPNPDPILRKAGKSEDVFDAIQADAHVTGELQSIQADLQRFKHQLTKGGDSRVDKRALDLCQAVLNRPPAPLTSWTDVFWNIGQDRFRGMSIHEMVWQGSADLWTLAQLLDRPKRRFSFNGMGELRLLTRDQPLFGEPVDEQYFLVSRHMPSYDQPYGVALLSSCFWPYVFKHAGYKWFVKFCERNSIPIPIGTYPVGAGDDYVNALEDALENLVEAGFAALEEGGDIKLLDGQKAAGNLAQRELIMLCNSEMSKALTSQTLATESPNSGSRAASETHASRAGNNNDGTRERIAYTLNKLWALLTLKNFGPDANPPTSSFLGDTEATLQRAQIYQIAINGGINPSRKAMADDLGIVLADKADPEDQLTAPAKPIAPGLPGAGIDPGAETPPEFAAPFADQAALDKVNLDPALQPVVEKMLQPILAKLKEGIAPEALLGQLSILYPQMDVTALQQIIGRALFVSKVWGRLTAGDGGA